MLIHRPFEMSISCKRREIKNESDGVCPKIVGQLLAVVLQGGQARQNRDTPIGRSRSGVLRSDRYRRRESIRASSPAFTRATYSRISRALCTAARPVPPSIWASSATRASPSRR